MATRYRTYPQSGNKGNGNGHPPADDAWLALVPREAGGASYDRNALQIGDLIVSTSTAWISERVRNHTDSPVSHVAIYVGSGQVVEAVDQGVRIRALSEALEDDYYAAAFRPDGLTDAQRESLARWLRSQVGRSYDYVAVASLLTYQNPEAWFCSELVLAAFEHIGKPLVSASSRSTPGEILQLSGVTYLGHLKYPPNVMGETQGVFTPDVEDRDALIPPGQGGMSIDTSILQVGDLVVTNADSIVSAAIRGYTDEPASHVALYIGDGEVIEAIVHGVTRRSLRDLLAVSHYAAAYRHVGISPQEQTAIRNFVLAQVGEPYDLVAIASLLRTHDEDAWFCSELVFEAYEAAGIRIGESSRSTPGQVITLSGFEYLGHLPAAGYVRGQSRSAAMGGGGLLASIVENAVVGEVGDVTWSFEKMEGKHSALHASWTPEERRAHDAPAVPYERVEFTTTEMHWDLGNIGATVPVEFSFNGHYISNLRVRRPINIDENFLYKLDINAAITLRENLYSIGDERNLSRVDLRITWLFDYEGITRIFQNFIEDTFTFVEEYRIHSNGTVRRRLSGTGRRPSDVTFMIHGREIPWFQAISQPQTADAPDLIDATFQGEWETVIGNPIEPVVEPQSALSLQARQLGRRNRRVSSGGLRARQAPALGGRSAGMVPGTVGGRPFSSQLGISTPSGISYPMEATVHFPRIEFPEGSVLDRLMDGVTPVLARIVNLLTPDALLEYCTRHNRTIAIGSQFGAGYGGAVDAGFGIVFAPGNRIGFYGSLSGGAGYNFAISGGYQLTYILGDESVFSGMSIVLGGSVSPMAGLGPSAGARWVMNTDLQTIGLTIEAGASVGVPGFATIEATLSAQRTVTTLGRRRAGGWLVGGQPSTVVPLARRRRSTRGRVMRAAGGAPVNARLRVFIPSPAVMLEAPVLGTDLRAFGGDGRDFSFDTGTSRASVDATLQLGRGGTSGVVLQENAEWGDSHRYAIADTFEVPNRPSWWRGIREGAGPFERVARLVRTADNLGVVATVGLGNVAAGAEYGSYDFHVDGGIPLLPDLAPNISATLRLELKRGSDGVLMARLTGRHDGFPAYELYVNGQPLHQYDPVTAGETPNALWGEGERSVHIEWQPVQGATAGNFALARASSRASLPAAMGGSSLAAWR